MLLINYDIMLATYDFCSALQMYILETTVSAGKSLQSLWQIFFKLQRFGGISHHNFGKSQLCGMLDTYI